MKEIIVSKIFRKFLILAILGLGVFIATDTINQPVMASDCYSNCEEVNYWCEIEAENNYTNCMNAHYGSYEYNGVIPNPEQCSTWRQDELGQCSNDLSNCYLNCGSGGSGSGGGGSNSRNKGPCEMHCEQVSSDCFDNASSQSEAQACFDDYEHCIDTCP